MTGAKSTEASLPEERGNIAKDDSCVVTKKSKDLNHEITANVNEEGNCMKATACTDKDTTCESATPIIDGGDDVSTCTKGKTKLLDTEKATNDYKDGRRESQKVAFLFLL